MKTPKTSAVARSLFIIVGLAIANTTAARPSPVLFSELGSHKRKVTTKSPEAQKWFNQGLNWYYAFNFDEARIAFQKAADLDPTCAMAWWGLSEAAGPQYNHPAMDAERTGIARKAMNEAIKHIEGSSAVERALIEALQQRNALEKPDNEKQNEQNKLYAEALAKVWKAFPKDADVGALYANARMTIRPWQLYETKKRVPVGDTKEIQAVVEQVLTVAPNHPGALHLYIHIVEPSKNPGLALSVAKRLDNLVPASSYLRHMPTHIYIQTGDWNRAIIQNAEAMGSDAAYRARAPGRTTQIGYQIHNAHMLSFAAMMSARRNEAMAAARAMWTMWEEVPDDTPAEELKNLAGYVDTVMPAVYDVHKRFGDWDALLAEREPARIDLLPITQAIRQASRAIAFANKGQFDDAENEFKKFKDLRDAFKPEHQFRADKATMVLEVSLHFIQGEIELNRENWEQAAKHLKKAIKIEDALSYTEPPQYLQPTRHALGAVLLKDGKPEQAARVYQRDLQEWPNNAWSLHGRMRALERQDKQEAATRAKARFKKFTEFSDFAVDSSCPCLPNP